MKLSAFQKKYLKSLAHDMSPVVMIGKQGLTNEVIDKVRGDLKAHELIKIKVQDGKVISSKEAVTRLANDLGAAVIKVVGHTAVLFKENPDNHPEYFKACGMNGKRIRLKGGKEEEI